VSILYLNQKINYANSTSIGEFNVWRFRLLYLQKNFVFCDQDCYMNDLTKVIHYSAWSENKFITLRTDDTNKKIAAWIGIYFLTYFHSKLYK
jgi:hypothetical protein